MRFSAPLLQRYRQSLQICDCIFWTRTHMTCIPSVKVGGTGGDHRSQRPLGEEGIAISQSRCSILKIEKIIRLKLSPLVPADCCMETCENVQRGQCVFGGFSLERRKKQVV